MPRLDLIETYAAATGLKIGRPNIKEQFFPLGFSRYITIQTGSGQQAKNFDQWNDVLRLLAPFLQKTQTQVVHLGAKDDFPLPGTVSLCGRTTLNQSLYILRRSQLHLGNDSWQAHMAGEANIPLVALYGTTDRETHGPHWQDSTRTVLIESHRAGNRTSFGQEPVKTVNWIPPERVANAALKLLDIEDKVAVKESLYIGPYYGHNWFEVIPDMVLTPQLYPDVPTTVRMDYLFNEENLLKQAQVRKIHVFTNQPIRLDVVKSILPQLNGFNYEVTIDTDLEYIKSLKKLGGKQIYFSKETTQSKLDDIRFKFFDVAPIEFVATNTKDKFLKEAGVYLNRELTELPSEVKFISSKLIFSQGKTYMSIPDWKADKPIPVLENATSTLIDSPEFWADYPHHYLYV